MKMKWQFATILTAICAVCAISSVGATESLNGLTRADVDRLKAQLQNGNSRDSSNTTSPTNGKTVAPPPNFPMVSHSPDQVIRLGDGPLAILKSAGNVQQGSGDARKPSAGQMTGVRTIEKPSTKGPKSPKRQKPSKRQAKSR